jgi:hypothetical protein
MFSSLFRFIFILPLLIGAKAWAQEKKFNFGEVHGDFQTDFQTYNSNPRINAIAVPEKSGSNSFVNLMYYRDNITAGVRFEGYYPALQGFDRRYKGGGLPYRFVSFKQHGLEVTAGNFYEQFGNGLTLRSYWEWGLGYDNSFDGFRVRYYGIKGLVLKGLIGDQRFYFDKSQGKVRGFDAEVNLNDLIPAWDTIATKVSFGGSFVSKFEADNDPVLKLPENVPTAGGRFNITRKAINLSAEYAHKLNDPSEINGNIYKNGDALWTSISYSPKNFGLVAQFKRIDNMNFRSSRTATLNDLMINYLPAGTPQHTYRLASIYPYATQPNGEIGLQLDLMYNFEEGTLLGGKYGTKISFNYSHVNNITRKPIDSITLAQEPNSSFLGYESSLANDLGFSNNQFRFGASNLYKNLSIEVNKKISDKWKLITSYIFIQLDNSVLKLSPYSGVIKSHILVFDLTWKIKSKRILRGEFQHLYSEQDYGNWMTFLGEFNLGHKWFFSVLDDYNYGYAGDVKPSQIGGLFSSPFHYLSGTVGYNYKTTRISLSYGRRRAGVLCVGGVCRLVPATDGLTMTISSSF